MNMTASPQNNNLIELNTDIFRKRILDWYDKHKRDLPWRAQEGTPPNPYHVWLSEIMLQQTTVITVAPYFQHFLTKWPTVHDLANASRDDVMHEWAGLGYYARARNLHKCAQIISRDLNGFFPESQYELEKLPGIGSYTSAAIRAIAFDKPANVVDGNIERIMARIFMVDIPLPKAKKQLKALAGKLSIERKDRPGDYAQALMDIGAGICTPKTHKCSLCPIITFCQAHKKDKAEHFPVKKPKVSKPHKSGHVYWIKNEKNEILFIRRMDTEMLGGMLGLPTTNWEIQKKDIKKRSNEKRVKNRNLSVRHSFTHFDLTLGIFTIAHKKGTIVPEKNHIWVASSEVEALRLPTLFSKVIKLMS